LTLKARIFSSEAKTAFALVTLGNPFEDTNISYCPDCPAHQNYHHHKEILITLLPNLFHCLKNAHLIMDVDPY